MQVREVLNVVNGRPLNDPFISSFANITTKISNVKKSSLFITKDGEFISEAISLGAYGILSQKALNIIDDEIAWIYVDDIDGAIFRLCKYLLIYKKVQLFKLDRRAFKLAKEIVKDPEVTVFDGNFDGLLELLNRGEIKIIFINNIDFEPLCTKMQAKVYRCLKLLRSSLFDCRVEVESDFYELSLPAFLLDDLNYLIFVCKKLNINFVLSKALLRSYIAPIFVNKSLKILDFGTGDSAIIALENEEDFRDTLKYLKTNAKYSKVKIFIKAGNSIKSENLSITYFSDEAEIMSSLAIMDYNFALVMGMKSSDMVKILENNKKENEVRNLFN